MSSPVDERARRSSSKRSTLRVAPDEPRRESAESRARTRDMNMLEALRKLRRDRSEVAMRDARSEVDQAIQRVLRERDIVLSKRRLYDDAQTAVSAALDTGKHSLDDIRKLLGNVDASRDAAYQAQGGVSSLLRDQRAAEARAVEALQAARVAAAAHEKVLEWKKSMSPAASA